MHERGCVLPEAVQRLDGGEVHETLRRPHLQPDERVHAGGEREGRFCLVHVRMHECAQRDENRSVVGGSTSYKMQAKSQSGCRFACARRMIGCRREEVISRVVKR